MHCLRLKKKRIELSESTLHHCRNNLQMKNVSIRGKHCTTPQLQRCLCRGTAKRNQAAGQMGVSPRLPRWETIEPNKWPSSRAHHLRYDSMHPGLFLRVEPVEPKWAAGQEVCGVLSPWVTALSLINDLLTSGGILWKEAGWGKSPGVLHTDVQRSAGLWLTFLLWVANR